MSRSFLIVLEVRRGLLQLLRRLFLLGKLYFNFRVGIELTSILSLETMTRDFDVKADKPSWSLSSYGPAKNEKNLLPPLDESPEELRFKAATAIRNGNINEYVRYHLHLVGRNLDRLGESFNMSKMLWQTLSRYFPTHATTSKGHLKLPRDKV